MRRRTALLAVLAAAAVFVVPTGSSAASITKDPVSFTVTNPGDPLGPSSDPLAPSSWTIKGFLMRPEGCTSSVLLATHGLSYGQWAWDFPLEPEKYSVARALAERGYATLAIDLLGYGESHKEVPNGYTLSVEAYAAMTSQIIKQIRGGTYIIAETTSGPAFGKVGLLGHSAGSEISELTTALYPDLVDALIATAYTHVPFVSAEWLQREWFQDNVRALQDDYEEFETDRETRDADMYYLPMSDPDVRDLDWELHNLTPSGQVLSIGLQPSRFLLPTITKPLLVVLAEKDVLFPGGEFGESEMLHFVLATDKTLHVIPDAGHVFMLEENGSMANGLIATWLDAHQAAIPAC
jgi:pimeloyl-ACP methyl ester carboxylesterase